MISLLQQRDPILSLRSACAAIGFSRATFHRHTSAATPVASLDRRRPPRQLGAAEETRILEVLHEERFIDRAPAEVVATLVDEDRYLGSVRTFYRVLHKHKEVVERRKVARRAVYATPRLIATRPNQVWCWDITKLRGPGKLQFFHLYVLIDLYSRYIVGWRVEAIESGELAEELIRVSIERHQVDPKQLTVHSDRGAAMKSAAVVDLLNELGATKTHSRPSVSDDNPFIESAFKTMKYGPGFPEQFSGLKQARPYLVAYVDWYNRKHRHSGIAMMTPEQVHFGKSEAVAAKRDVVLKKAFELHPERFVNGPPQAPRPPTEVYINPPKQLPTEERPLAATKAGPRS